MHNYLENHKTKFILIFTLALVVRLAGITSRPIWYDEAFSILISEQGPSAIVSSTLALDTNSSAAEEHPPAYYFMLWGWMQAFGNSLVAIRMLSILISLGIILCIYLITSYLFDPPTALTAAFISAILPFQVHYGQEIRMYVLLTFWLCLATLAFIQRKWILFSIAAALAQYTHNLAAFYLIPLAFTPIFQKDWKTLRSLTLAGFASIIIYSPWLIQLPRQVTKVTANFWVERPGIEKIFTLILFYLPHLPLPNSLLLPGLLIATLTIALAIFQTVITRKKESEAANKILWLGYLAFMPPILLWSVSQFVPVYIERALLPSHAIFCVWLAAAFKQTKLPRAIQILTSLLIVTSSVTGIYQHLTYKGFPYGPYKALNESVQSRLEEGDVIIHSSKLSYLPSFYFDQNISQGFIVDPLNSNVDTLAPATRELLNLNSYEDLEKATVHSSRVWFIIYQQSIDEFKQVDKMHPHLEYLNKNFTLESVESWNDARLYMYIAKTAQPASASTQKGSIQESTNLNGN
jgi:4-amino-4-deoxy-L-arabinose transferase-like glycosyltransferase